MEKKNRPSAALLAVFPSIQSYIRLAEDRSNAKTLKSFISFAKATQLIAEEKEDALRTYIQDNTPVDRLFTPPSHMNFERFFDQKESLLALNLSARALTNRINALISDYQLELPKVSNSMLTRLKREPADTLHKQNVLRSLAFWIGHDRPQHGPVWHYETLFKLCGSAKPQTDHKEGVRIGFALHSRGDVIDHEIVGWLKRELKGYIEQSISRFSYGRWGKLRSHGITTVYVDFPKENDLANPAHYLQSLNSAIALAHQIALRWSLSKYYSQNRLLSIGLAAGLFASLDNHLLPILNAKLPGDPAIRLTDYARQCILINDLRVSISSESSEITLFNEEPLTIWWIEGFWTTLYFDFIPDLLSDELLQDTRDSATNLAGALWLSLVESSPEGQKEQPNAINTFFRHPHNALLGVEIAKTLFYRRLFWEANEVLRIVLSLDAANLSARCMQMTILRNLASDAPDLGIADALFGQAHHEAEYIKSHFSLHNADFYCECGIVHLSQAMYTLRHLREKHPTKDDQNAAELKAKIMASMKQADTLFGTALMLSPNGARSNYLLNSIKTLTNLLKSDDALFFDANCPLDARPGAIPKPVSELQWQAGYLRENVPQSRPFEMMEKLFSFTNINYIDSINQKSYLATVYYCVAVAWWDLFPARTLKNALDIVRLLEASIALAKEQDKKKVCIYSYTRVVAEMMPAKKFIGHVEKIIEMVKEQIGENPEERDAYEILTPKNTDRTAMMLTLNF